MAGAPQVVYAQPAVMAQPIVMGATPQVMVVQQARIYGKLPVATTCPFCNRSITTSVVTQPGCFAWASAGILCVIGCELHHLLTGLPWSIVLPAFLLTSLLLLLSATPPFFFRSLFFASFRLALLLDPLLYALGDGCCPLLPRVRRRPRH